MFRNYLKVAIRSLGRHKGYAAINIAGLSIGMMACLLIMLFVQYEFSYDKFHENADRLYSVVMRNNLPEGTAVSDVQPGAMAAALKENLPQVVDAARAMMRRRSICRDDKSTTENVVFADASMLTMFSFPLSAGDPATALSDPHSIVISREVAEKHFAGDNPIGQTISIDHQQEFQVSGVLKDIPDNSSIRADVLVPIAFLKEMGINIDEWGGGNFITYVLLHEGASVDEVGVAATEFMGDIYRQMMGEEPPDVAVVFHPLTRLHLYDLDGDGGPIQYIYILMTVGLFVLVIACVNFVNLSTARSMTRSREVGVRKVAGATRSQMMGQVLVEALLYSVVSLFIALALVELTLPAFRALTERPVSLDLISNLPLLGSVIGIVLLGTVLSGFYPALLFSSLPPAKIFMGGAMAKPGRAALRKVLVVTQFAMAVVLIIGSLVMSGQLDYLQEKELGLKKDAVVWASASDVIKEKYDSFRDVLLSQPSVEEVGTSVQHIFYIYSSLGPSVDWEGKSDDREMQIHFDWVRPGYIETLGMEMAAGRSFSAEFPSDTIEAVILNEKAVKMLGIDDPVGKRFSYWGNDRRIVGVVRDFHYQSLRSEIKPLVLICSPSTNYVYVKVNPEDMTAALGQIEEVWNRFDAGSSFEYRFLGASYDHLYDEDRRLGTISKGFTALAVVIACLGLLGLAAALAERRTREIGIRKVHGASVSSIVLLLSRDFVKWVLVANVVAFPVAYYALNRWLQSYAYRIDIGWQLFASAAALTLVIAAATVSYQSVRAALASPVNTVRHE